MSFPHFLTLNCSLYSWVMAGLAVLSLGCAQFVPSGLFPASPPILVLLFGVGAVTGFLREVTSMAGGFLLL